MDAHIHPARDDLSPTSDSAIDMPESTDPKAEPEREIPRRLATLAQRMISTTNLGCHLQDPPTVLECLDRLERAVSPHTDGETDPDPDPRTSVALEIAQYRPQSQSRNPTGSTSTSRSFYRSAAPSPSTVDTPTQTQTQDRDHDRDHDRDQRQHQERMQILLDHLTAQTTALLARRTEATHIYNLFTQRCDSLETKVRGLRDEIRELKTNITESSVERETLRGTVLGLQDWITAWERECLPGPDTGSGHGETETLVEGISAWMRGWRDVDDGIGLRERERELRSRLREL